MFFCALKIFWKWNGCLLLEESSYFDVLDPIKKLLDEGSFLAYLF